MKFVSICTVLVLSLTSANFAQASPVALHQEVFVEESKDLDAQNANEKSSFLVAGILASQRKLTFTQITSEQPDIPSSQDVPAKLVRQLELGFGITAGITMATGIIISSIGAAQVSRLKNEEMWCIPDTGAKDPYIKCRVRLANAFRTRDIGLSVLGGGVGLLTGGLIWMIRDSSKRRVAWITEIVMGGASMVGGFFSLYGTSRPFNIRNTHPDWPSHYQGVFGKVGGHAVSMTLLGFGTGLLISAATGLGVQRRYTRSLQITPTAGSGQAGLLLTGVF